MRDVERLAGDLLGLLKTKRLKLIVADRMPTVTRLG